MKTETGEGMPERIHNPDMPLDGSTVLFSKMMTKLYTL